MSDRYTPKLATATVKNVIGWTTHNGKRVFIVNMVERCWTHLRDPWQFQLDYELDVKPGDRVQWMEHPTAYSVVRPDHVDVLP